MAYQPEPLRVEYSTYVPKSAGDYQEENYGRWHIRRLRGVLINRIENEQGSSMIDSDIWKVAHTIVVLRFFICPAEKL